MSFFTAVATPLKTILPAPMRKAMRRAIGRRANQDVFPPLEGRYPLDLALIVGAQRSGTTWLEMLMGAHPKIVAGEESHLFSQYIGSLTGVFYQQCKQMKTGRPQGLPCYLTYDEFDALMAQFARAVLTKLMRAKPGATLVVEKTPDHVLHLSYIRKLFPRVKIVHMLRDGRDVVVSQLAAGQQNWGKSWAPADARSAAQRWYEWVAKARAWSKPEALYHEVRYEQLLSDGPRTLGRVYEFLGVPLADEKVRSIYDQFSLEACSSNQAPQVQVSCGVYRKRQTAAPPSGFFRKGQAGGWRESLSPEQVSVVEEAAGPMLRELGYI